MEPIRITPAGRRVWAEVDSMSSEQVTVQDWSTPDRCALSIGEGFEELYAILDASRARKVRDGIDAWLASE